MLFLLIAGNLLMQAGSNRSANDWLIVPGVRVGPITARSSDTELREVFGPMVITTERITGEVETNNFTTLLFRNDPRRAIAISWENNAAKKQPDNISFCWGAQSNPGAWHTKSGIHCGTTLSEIQELNQKPFALSGYNHDYSGTVVSWNGGKLEGDLGSRGTFEIAVNPIDAGWMRKLTPAEIVSLEKPSILSSDTVLQKLSPVVSRMVVRLASTTRKD